MLYYLLSIFLASGVDITLSIGVGKADLDRYSKYSVFEGSIIESSTFPEYPLSHRDTNLLFYFVF